MENHSKNWYAVITAPVLYNKNLSDKQKLLIAVISNLSNEKGYCFASNQYLADVLGCDKLTISRHLSALEKEGYLNRVIVLDENGSVKYRTLTVIESFNYQPLMTKPITPHDETGNTHIDENVNYNNKHIKNKDKNIYNSGSIFLSSDNLTEKKEMSEKKITVAKRKKMFESKIEVRHDFLSDMRQEFIDYWTELNKSGTKMRFEDEKFFDINRRINTWKKNNGWKAKKPQITPKIDPNNVW